MRGHLVVAMIYKVTVAYDGSHYAGWQKQINALGIQEVIEKALTKIHKKETEIVASGRTDAKVHALGQVFHFEADPLITPQGYQKALNALLPKDIRICHMEQVNDDFHARFHAKWKCYEYICTYQQNNPFIYNYKQVLLHHVDIDRMKEGAKIFLGDHDFTSFCSSKIDPRKPRVKHIQSIEIYKEQDDIHFIYIGNGFLRYQVRMMTGTLLALGQHRIEVDDLKTMLEAKDKHACRYNASPEGLYLKEVRYES